MAKGHFRATEEELERFRGLVRGMSRDSAVYRMLKEELTARGYWKAAPRGRPAGNGWNATKEPVALACEDRVYPEDWGA